MISIVHSKSMQIMSEMGHVQRNLPGAPAAPTASIPGWALARRPWPAPSSAVEVRRWGVSIVMGVPPNGC